MGLGRGWNTKKARYSEKKINVITLVKKSANFNTNYTSSTTYTSFRETNTND